jgi:hypothetical protein
MISRQRNVVTLLPKKRLLALQQWSLQSLTYLLHHQLLTVPHPQTQVTLVVFALIHHVMLNVVHGYWTLALLTT